MTILQHCLGLMREKYRWSTNETGMSLSVQVHSASINSETRIRKNSSARFRLNDHSKKIRVLDSGKTIIRKRFECSIPAKRSFEKDSSARFRLNDHSKKIRVLDSTPNHIFPKQKKPRSIEPLDNHLELLQIIYYNLVSSSLTRPVSSSTSNSS